MVSTVYSTSLYGIDGYKVTVECYMGNSLPSLNIVGLPDLSIKESRDRIRAALKSNGLSLPGCDITVNLAPADKKKEGAALDLAILVAILARSGAFEAKLDKSCFIGELSLSGEVRAVKGILSMCIAAKDAGICEVYVPEGNAGEAALTRGITVYPVRDVKQLQGHLSGLRHIEPVKPDDGHFLAARRITSFDFSEVKGQDKAKRALEIAAAGGHNVLLIGPPGTGKSMLAKRIPGIMPDISFDEAVETTKIHSVTGILPDGVSIITQRPFRSPHHTISSRGLIGGGGGNGAVSPGEVSLAHNGVLFLDEFPEFGRDCMEVLRQPLEDGEVTITRVSSKLTFPSAFMLVCAMNPCKCGYYGHPAKRCTCSDAERKKYMGRISGPLLDRFDIQIEVPSVPYEAISSIAPGESSLTVRQRVEAARAMANSRYAGEKRRTNAAVTSSILKAHTVLDPDAAKLLQTAFDSMGLSARGYDRILRLCRTIADLSGSEAVTRIHVAEAIQLRSLDKKYW